MKVYGYVNGRPIYNRDEWIYSSRGFGPLLNDDDLLTFSGKVTHKWHTDGWRKGFEQFPLFDFETDQPYASLTQTEFNRLKTIQMAVKEKIRRFKREKGWELVETVRYEDNSAEEIYENRYGERKTVQIESPHETDLEVDAPDGL